MSKRIKLIIFDLDDTLVRSQIDYNAIRTKLSTFFTDNPSSSDLSFKPILALLKQISEDNPQNYEKAKLFIEENEREAVLNAQIMDGADDVPNILARYNAQGAIYTNNSAENMNLYLKKPGFEFLHQFFFLTRTDVTEPKPNPEGIIKILSKYNYIAKENVIFIGDSPLDAQAAHGAGIRFILYNSRNLSRDVFPEDIFGVINHWSELETLLKS